MDKYAGKEIDIMTKHFTNKTVYAFVIRNILHTTVDKLNCNQNAILFLREELQP